MKRALLLLALLGCGSDAPTGNTPPVADVSGTWYLPNTYCSEWTLQQSNGTVSGTCSGPAVLEPRTYTVSGEVRGDHVGLSFATPAGNSYSSFSFAGSYPRVGDGYNTAQIRGSAIYHARPSGTASSYSMPNVVMVRR